MKSICVTGHRPNKLKKLMQYGNLDDCKFCNYRLNLYEKIVEYINSGYTHFICGGALGVDLDFAEIVIKIKEHKDFVKYGVELEIAIPCKNQALRWSISDKARYDYVLKKANYCTYINDEYSYSCMQERNVYMVDNSQLVLAVWDGDTQGGTYNTIKYAKKQNKEIDYIYLA